MTPFVRFSIVESGLLNRIEEQLKQINKTNQQINKKLDVLLSSPSVTPEQLAKLTQLGLDAKSTSDVLSKAIEENK